VADGASIPGVFELDWRFISTGCIPLMIFSGRKANEGEARLTSRIALIWDISVSLCRHVLRGFLFRRWFGFRH
jgi:hypothetical protein